MSLTTTTDTLFVLGLTFKKKVGTSLLIQQLKALFTKRVLFTRRKWLTFLLHVRRYNRKPV